MARPQPQPIFRPGGGHHTSGWAGAVKAAERRAQRGQPGQKEPAWPLHSLPAWPGWGFGRLGAPGGGWVRWRRARLGDVAHTACERCEVAGLGLEPALERHVLGGELVALQAAAAWRIDAVAKAEAVQQEARCRR